MEKKILREQMQILRKQQSAAIVKLEDLKMFERLVALPEYKECTNLLSYVSFNGEADTFLLLRHAIDHGKKVSVPKICQKGMMEFFVITSLSELKIGKFGIMEPNTDNCFPWKPAEKTLMLLPGLAFDVDFYRLGYGGGCYDRYLDKHKQFSFVKAVFCYPFQRIERIPRESHDLPVDLIIMPETAYYNLTEDVSASKQSES